ncbi:hypothetical protein RN001_006307 [Aquatica leii]|uniref:Myrosinase 1-like n=1 Tax=Aquatica leii TaxID=1421715 RepID=A0AAN7SQ63_9COLE|nr:hypothetical protein RN001_006307 [Aquatica leii]
MITINIYVLFLLFNFVIAIEKSNTNQVFPQGFKFGVSSSAYQIEGNWDSTRGKNIWDESIRVHPAWIKDNQTGNKACDSYNLWKRDVEMLNELGVHYYSFSISWSRLLPNGFPNYINPDAVEYYNNLINELIQNDIEPVVTLYVWDLPQSLQDMGGWPNAIIAKHYENYAEIAFSLFGDRVKTWITFNDPYEICVGGYGEGTQAPGVTSSGISDYLCGKTLLTAHSRAYYLYKNRYAKSQSGKIGIAIKAQWYEPGSILNDDIEASIRAFEMISGWWINPIFSKRGDYPDVMKTRIQTVSNLQNFYESRLPYLSSSEIRSIRGTADFLGINHFSTITVRNLSSSDNIPVSYSADVNVKYEVDSSGKSSALPWVKNTPFGFRKLLDWIRQKYGNPVVYITENGYPDYGLINDADRIDYLRGYLVELLNAIHNDNCTVQRYTVRSLMDSMEWRNGYLVKFGLYHVNFADSSTTRKPKESANFFKSVIRTREVSRVTSHIMDQDDLTINPRR